MNPHALSLDRRSTAIGLTPDEFRTLGHQLVEDLAQLLGALPSRPVTTQKSPKQLSALLGDFPLPENGTAANELLKKTTQLLAENSLFNGHPKFFGYITSSPAPLGALADLLAATINPNVGANVLSPMATQIEKQTIGWLCDFIGVPNSYGGVLVSGGNMANLTAFFAALTAKLPHQLKEEGLAATGKRYAVYCAKTTHTWIDKAAHLSGLGKQAVRMIEVDHSNRINTQALRGAITKDKQNGILPLMAIGTAGDVSTGVVDNLLELASICRTENLWFHIDGAYGVPAAVLPNYQHLFQGMDQADSIAIDPHKWLYAPLEAGCTLVRNPQHLIATYSSHPEYYKFDAVQSEVATNFYEYGFQNSRGFRALKVWLTLQQIGKVGYMQLIEEDIELAKYLFQLADQHPHLEAVSHNLSITTLRYIPSGTTHSQEYLNELNEQITNQLQSEGVVFLSNANVQGTYCLRACVVNFRTTKKDMEEVVDYLVNLGHKIHAARS